MLASVILFSLASANAVSLVSSPYTLNESGELGGNDTSGLLEALLKGIDATFDTTLTQTKHDSDQSGNTGGLFIENTGDVAGSLSGTWYYTGTQLLYAFVTKGSNSFKFYYFVDSEGKIAPIPTFAGGNEYYEYAWDTVGLVNRGGQQPGVSHSSVYSAPGGTTNVPEPMTLALTGGLIGGLSLLRRRK